MNEKINTKLFIGCAGQDEIQELMDEVSKESHNFDSYLITYIDFLGMTNKMKENESYESLQFLRYILSGIVHRASIISGTNKDFFRQCNHCSENQCRYSERSNHQYDQFNFIDSV